MNKEKEVGSENTIKASTQAFSHESSEYKSGVLKDKNMMLESGNIKTYKNSFDDNICLEIEEHGNKTKSRSKSHINHPRAASYSVEKQRPVISNIQVNTGRSNHTPIIPDLKETNTKFLPELDSQRFEDSHRIINVKRDANDSNDIAIETFRGSTVSVV
jgi:hypothetical protein